MDKNEYNLKLQEINRYVDQESYEEAAQTADQIDWKRVRNVRTLCLISEVYEAVDRLQDSKDLLVSAYRRSPIGKTVLYRLTEITIKLKQFDEAIEYYSEYVQAAPHDISRYILKYKIYRGRGSSVDEQIDILKEYLDQEFNEKYAYELAKLYQQADRIQECLAQCDDLVLWFQSGHYVLKALELKQRYAKLTPKQQVIYERECSREEAGDTDEPGQEKQMVSEEVNGTADIIIEDTAREIAETVKASVEEEIAEANAEESGTETAETEEAKTGAADQTVVIDREQIRAAAEHSADETAPIDITPQELQDAWQDLGDELPVDAESAPAEGAAAEETEPEAEAEAAASEASEASAPADTAALADTDEESDETDISAADTAENSETEAAAEEESSSPAAAADDVPEVSDAEPAAAETRKISYDPESLQSEVAHSMKQIMSGVGIRDTVDPDEEIIDEVIERSKKDQEASIASRENGPGVRMNNRLQMPARKDHTEVGKLSIDDVLLSMGEKGNAVREAVAKAGIPTKKQPDGVLSAVDEALLNMGVSPEKLSGNADSSRSSAHHMSGTMEEIHMPGVFAAAEEEQPETDRDAEPKELTEEETVSEADAEQTDASEPADEQSDAAETAEQAEMSEEIEAVEAEEPADDAETEDQADTPSQTADSEEAAESSAEEEEEELPVYELNRHAEDTLPEDEAEEEEPEDDAYSVQTDAESSSQQGTATDAASQNMSMEDIVNARTRRIPRSEIEERLAEAEAEAAATEADAEAVQSEAENTDADTNGERRPRRKRRLLPRSVRNYFHGFTAVPDMEMQIDSAIRQALGKGSDRTSRTGNILIFGAHGSGKTTLATALAKAIGTSQNREFVKMAKIYATELNRRDIAATIARIAGGILIIEEAGDMEDSIADQLTTAMEFRTDGLIILMEDEERYLRSLMIRHPRLMMKFTSQIIIPQYTTSDLLNFADTIARESQCTLSAQGADALADRAERAFAGGDPLTLIDIRDMVERAVKRSGKLTRKMFGGKKRFDEEGFVLLTAKDFR